MTETVTPTGRPTLSIDIDAATFEEHYWLRAELATFCRENGLSVAGGKQALVARIAAFLRGDSQPLRPAARPRSTMPKHFSRDTPIGSGWRCSQALRAFISAEIGRPFKFDRFMRAQIAEGSGALLGDVIEAWSKQEGQRHEIEPQFEYNRFVRAFRELAPGTPHSSIVAAWRQYRSMPVSKRPRMTEVVSGKALT